MTNLRTQRMIMKGVVADCDDEDDLDENDVDYIQ